MRVHNEPNYPPPRQMKSRVLAADSPVEMPLVCEFHWFSFGLVARQGSKRNPGYGMSLLPKLGNGGGFP